MANILIGCEYSGIVRNAFTALGHNALSVDLLPSETKGNHIEGDILDVIRSDNWDLLIAFPPCTHLAVSGARYFEAKRADGRQQDALVFIKALLTADVPRIALENPVGVISTYIRKPDQIIQPWMFGEDASKKTCLWLKNLPKLEPTKIIIKDRYGNQTPSGQNNLPPSAERWKMRSRTYKGIANAMAEQWGKILYGMSSDDGGRFGNCEYQPALF